MTSPLSTPERSLTSPAPVDPRATLVVFTLGPAVEARRRRLLGPTAADLETELYLSQLDGLLSSGREAGLRLVVASNAAIPSTTDVARVRQPSGTFGQRLTGSLSAACGDRRAPWIVVGADTPDIDGERLRQVSRLLRAAPHRVVLGPALDGGIYLIAASRDLRPLLAQVSWGHRRTGDSLRRRLAAQGYEIVELAPLSDLDQPGDLKRWLLSARRSSPTRDPLLAVVRRLLIPDAPLVEAAIHRLQCPFVPALGGRAPPA